MPLSVDIIFASTQVSETFGLKSKYCYNFKKVYTDIVFVLLIIAHRKITMRTTGTSDLKWLVEIYRSKVVVADDKKFDLWWKLGHHEPARPTEDRKDKVTFKT